MTDIEQALSSRVELGRAAHQGVRIDSAVFVRHMAERIPAEGDPLAALSALHVEDLFLACGLAQKQLAAVAELERAWIPLVASAVRRVNPAPAFVDEVVQLLRLKLLAPLGTARPKIFDYAGRGPLRSWLRAAAITTALNLCAERVDGVPLEEQDSEDMPLTEDPTVALLKQRHRADFQSAFQEAFDALPDRDVNLLRLHYLDGLSSERIGALYSAHRATVARWLGVARAALLEGTRRRLAARLGLPDDEIDSLIRVVQSRLDESLSRIFRVQRK